MTTKDSVVVTARLRMEDNQKLKDIKEEYGMTTAGVILYAIANLRKQSIQKTGPRLIFPHHRKQRMFYTELLKAAKSRGENPKLSFGEVKTTAYKVGIMTSNTRKSYIEALAAQGFCAVNSHYVVVLKKWDTNTKE